VAGRQVALRAASGEALAERTLEAWVSRLARGLASVVNVVDPEVIVVGGGLSRLQAIYTEVPAIWSRWIFSDRIATKIVPARHGDASGVRGAAWLWR